MNVTLLPRPLAGCVAAPPAKSQAHRALICAALADRPMLLTNVGTGQDVAATIACLRALGAVIDEAAGSLHITPICNIPPHVLMNCGESGSTLRFLLPVEAALGAECVFTAEDSLARRPIVPLAEQLTAHGIRLSPAERFPLTCAGVLQAGDFTLPGHISSQFITGLLLALPRLPGDSTLRLTTPLVSRPYVEMTRDMLARFGIAIEDTPNGWHIPGGQRFRAPERLQVEVDWSGAAFWLTAGALSGAGMRCEGLNSRSHQGDRVIAGLLRRFGALVTEEANAVTVRPGKMKALELDAADIPDLVPVLAVAAAAAKGETRIHAIGRLRLKESDRVESILALLRALGIRAGVEADTLCIQGGTLQGGVVDACGDHRIAMAAAVAACAAQRPVTVLGVECTAKSYPDFFAHYAALGGAVREAEP